MVYHGISDWTIESKIWDTIIVSCYPILTFLPYNFSK